MQACQTVRPQSRAQKKIARQPSIQNRPKGNRGEAKKTNTRREDAPAPRIEIWDIDDVRHLQKLANIDIKTLRQLQTIEHRIVKATLEVQYHRKHIDDDDEAQHERDWGRLYAKQGLSYQSLKRCWRHLLAYRHYHDLDFADSLLTILDELCHRYGIQRPVLRRYRDNRDRYLAFGNRDAIKRAVNCVVFGGKAYMPRTATTTTTEQRNELEGLLEGLQIEMFGSIVPALYNHDHFREERAEAQRLTDIQDGDNEDADENSDDNEAPDPDDVHHDSHGDDDDAIKKRKFLALILQRREDDALGALIEFLQRKGFNAKHRGVLMFDGIMIERRKPLPPPSQRHAIVDDPLPHDLLQQASEYIRRKTGWPMRVIEKTLIPTAEEWALWDGPLDLEMMTHFERLTYLLAQYGKKNKLARTEDAVMQQHPSIVGCYRRLKLDANETNKAPDKEVTSYINLVLRDDPVFRQSNRMKDLIEWFLHNDHPDFPIVAEPRSDRHFIAFLNGYYNLHHSQFHTLEQFRAQFHRDPCCFHYYDCEWTPQLIHEPTPSWDKLLRTQFSERVAQFLEVLTGRLLFPVKLLDNWQLAIYLKGDANTGKSTLLEQIVRMLPEGTIGTMGENGEPVFGLDGLDTRRLFAFPDVPEKLSQVLPQMDFQKMVSGELMSVRRKHKKAVMVEWAVPLLLAGNHLPDYKDNSGSISRRYCLFLFETLITDRDTQLKEKMTRETPAVLLRCVQRYHDFVREVGTKDIWTVVPQEVKDMQSSVKAATNPLYDFIENGNDSIAFVHDVSASITVQDFQRLYRTHCLSNLITYRWTDDYYPFKSLGFTIDEAHMCKGCWKEAKSGCCPAYSANNRSRRKLIRGMRKIEKPMQTNNQAETPTVGEERIKEGSKSIHSPM